MLNPASVARRYLEFGLYGWAMSRFSGAWVGFKALIGAGRHDGIRPSTVDLRSRRAAYRHADRFRDCTPGQDLHMRSLGMRPLEKELLPAPSTGCRPRSPSPSANPIDKHIVTNPPNAAHRHHDRRQVAIYDVLQALRRSRASIRTRWPPPASVIYKVGMTAFPIEPEAHARNFAPRPGAGAGDRGEARASMERQLQVMLLYGLSGLQWPQHRRQDATAENGKPLLPSVGDLSTVTRSCPRHRLLPGAS